MKFSEYTYERIDSQKFTDGCKALIEKLKTETTAEAQIDALLQIGHLLDHASTNVNYLGIKAAGYTNDTYWQQEYAYAQQVMSELQSVMALVGEAVLKSPYTKAFEEKFGKIFLQTTANSIKTSQPAANELSAKEGMIAVEYAQLAGSAKIEVRGEQYNIMSLSKISRSEDRQLRKEAADAESAFFEQNNDKLESIFSRLFDIRQEKARVSGFPNFVEYALCMHNRIGFTQHDINNFRSNVAKYFTPLVAKIDEYKKRTLHIDTITYYDDAVLHLSGQSKPVYQGEALMDKAEDMYKEFSPEAWTLFKDMRTNEMLDTEDRPNKIPGGFATLLPDMHSPFILTSFTGGAFDVMVLTHEFGHTFQFSYATQGTSIFNNSATLDCVEVYSHGMEFLTLPWMKDLFGEDAAKFKYEMLVRQAKQVSSACVADEFQYHIYSEPTLDFAKVNSTWKELRAKYGFRADKTENKYYAGGNKWKTWQHIFEHPFYMIDYAYAVVVAAQLGSIQKKDFNRAKDIYVELCKRSGGASMSTLLPYDELLSPFQEGAVERAAAFLEQEIDEAYAALSN
jgi:M3 family oligoendopeptidase